MSISEARDGDVVTLTFDDPERLNAMTQSMGEALRDRVEKLKSDSGVRAVILTGKGRAFSAGGDLEMLMKIAERAREGDRRDETHGFMRAFYQLFLSIRELPCPTIAAINGHAIGAGLCVALACDFRYIAEEARIGVNFGKLGIHPGMGASWTLPRLVGPARAAELLYTSRIITGQDALAWGIANRCFPAAEVLPAALTAAREIADCAPFAIRELKQGLAHSEGADIDAQLDFEASSQARCFETDDILEGLVAARDKRAPRFDGR